MSTNKYDKFFNKMLKISLFVIASIVLLASIIAPLLVDILVTKAPSASLFLEPIGIALFFAIGLDICGGIAFRNYELENSGIVGERGTMFFIRRTEPVIKRHMLYSTIIAICELVLLITNITFVFINEWKVGNIFGMIESLVIGVIAYFVAQKERVDLKNKNYKL